MNIVKIIRILCFINDNSHLAEVMKNPLIIILIVAGVFLLISGKLGFFIPAVVLFFVFKANQGNKKRRQEHQEPRSTGRWGYDPDNRRRASPPRSEFERRRPGPPPRPRQQPKARPKPNPYKNSGVVKYKDFDYSGAIEDFKKALDIDPNDIPSHFNIACAYSLTEQKDLAFRHLDKAVQLGYKDFEKLKTHDAFAFIRIQDDFETFEENGFRLVTPENTGEETVESVDPQLLERLKKLAELKEQGILTEKEFLIQKEKLLR